MKRFIRLLTVGLLILIQTAALFVSGSTEKAYAAASRASYLFVGNSLTYYNNSPEMFARLVKTGTGKDVDCVDLIYNSRCLKEHANAIAAVVRTKGDFQELTDQEKEYFYPISQTIFSEKIYNGYAERIWDYENERPFHFDRIILQMHLRNEVGDTSSEEIAAAIAEIVKAFDSTNTTYVVNAVPGRYHGGMFVFREDMDEIDREVEEGVASALRNVGSSCRDIRICYSGRAMYNYLAKYGGDYAQKKEPAAYEIYRSNTDWFDVQNDVIYGDQMHPTQLGSYIMAATLYSLLYGNPTNTVEDYRAGVKKKDVRLDGSLVSGDKNIAAIYKNGNGFRNTDILWAGASSAWNTQRKSLNLEPVNHNTTRNGWERDGENNWYCYKDGQVRKGWIKNEGFWYYLSPVDGKAKVGWLRMWGRWYYMGDMGRMLTGWINSDGKWYLMGGEGALVTGWRKTGGSWYYLDPSGEMLTGNQLIDGKYYYFDRNGKWNGK